MKNTVIRFLDRQKQNQSRRRKTAAILACLSLIVAGGTVWALHMTGESQTGETWCGYTEHRHSEECIGEKTLICGYDTQSATEAEPGPGTPEPESEAVSAHTHSDACYETQTVLTCTETEHTHSAENGCYETRAALICTETEHQHGAECYDEEGNLICGVPEHMHSEEEGCYTAEQALICTIPEHNHSEENGCYTTEQVLICGLEEGSTGENTEVPAGDAAEETAAAAQPAHVHTDACYEIIYTCGKEEHQHTLSCFSNPEADIETAADWEKTFADVELTGVYADDLLAIAKTQLGYAESADNYQVVPDAGGNETTKTKGYTRYGAWYGMPYEDWCAMFVSFCLHYAEIPQAAFPRDASCPNWIRTLSDPEKGYELYRDAADYSPCPGDLVFFDTDEDGEADHVGIVSGLTPEYTGTEESYEDDADYSLAGFKTIEGNSSDRVQENEYELTDKAILGYGALPENPEKAGDQAENGEEDKTGVLTADAGDGVTFAAEGRFPEGAYLAVCKLDENQIACIGERFAGVALGAENFAYDIKICGADGKELETGSQVHITVSGLPAAGEAGVRGYHLTDVDADSLADADAENTVVEEIDVTCGGGGLSFDTDGFSVMIFTVGQALTGDPVNYSIDQFQVAFVSGGVKTDTDADGTKDLYVWNATDTASGHEFVYRASYTVSGGTIPAGQFAIRLPLHMLRDQDKADADSFDCPFLNENELAAGDSPDFLYRVEGDCVYIYNYTEMASGLSGNIEFSYTTTKRTYDYRDMDAQTEETPGTKKLNAQLTVGVEIDEIAESGAPEGTTKAGEKAAEESFADGVTINTGEVISSTFKQTPTRYTTWQSGWGDAPADAADSYYFVWPVYTVVAKGTQRYNLTLEDAFSDFGGQVVACRFSGSSTWETPGADGSATVEGLLPSDGVGRYDYVLVSCSREEILTYLKEQYAEILKDSTTLEEAEKKLFEEGVTCKYTIQNSVTVTVTPADGVDPATSASAAKTYVYERLGYVTPGGEYGAEKWGIDHSNSRVYGLDDISSYKLSEYLEGTEDSLTGLKYYAYASGYPGSDTLQENDTGTLQDAIDGKFFQASVTYSLEDADFSLQALAYDSSYESADGKRISGTRQALETGDYDITSLQWRAVMKTARYDEEKMGFVSASVTDFSELDYTPESGFEKNTLYFRVYACEEGADTESWLLAATCSLEDNSYAYSGSDGTAYPGSRYIDGEKTSGKTLVFNEGVKGYRIETSNPFYYTEIGAYPTISLNRTGHVAQILLGAEDAAADDLPDLADKKALSKIALTNKAAGTVSRDGDNKYRGVKAGTDYIFAVMRDSALTKRIASTLNDKRKQQYEITWSVALQETYTDGDGNHYVAQESGVFYDLLPAGAALDMGSITAAASSGALTSGEYTLTLLENYRGSGRSMLKVEISGSTESSYRLTYTTSHSWEAVWDYGQSVLNSVAYETGNGDIGEGHPDAGGTIEDKSLMANLTEETEDDSEGTEKFLYNQASWDINILLASNTGLLKQVKSSGGAEYSYSATVSADGGYSYQARFANDAVTASEDIMLFDSLENYSPDGSPLSDWHGTLTGIGCSQLDKKGVPYKIYVSETENLDIDGLNWGEDPEGYRNYEFETETAAEWILLETYQEGHADLSGVRAVAVDARGYRLAAGDSLVFTLYMKAPASAEDPDFAEDGDDNAYADPKTCNNIYISRTALAVVTDPETGDTETDEDSGSPVLSHQDYTQVHFRQTGDVLLKKVNAGDSAEAVKGAVYQLSGASMYGTHYELTATSGKDGSITFGDLELTDESTGVYELREISCSPDWQLNTEVYQVKIEVVDGEAVTTLSGYDFPDEDGDGTWDTADDGRYLLTDEPRIHADVSFHKADSITGQDVEGAQFKLYGISGYGNDVLMYAVSREDGAVSFKNVEYGSYAMTEIAAPEGYIMGRAVWTVQVDENGMLSLYTTDENGKLQAVEQKEGEYVLENEPYHQVQFLKRSAYGKDNYIEGIRFKLYGISDYGNSYEKEAVSGEHGLVTFGGLEPGTYSLAETDTSGAKDSTWDDENQENGLSYPVDSRVYTVVVEADGGFAITGLGQERIDIGGDGSGEDFHIFPNTPENGVITVTKVWLDGGDDAARKPTDLDITVSAAEPDSSEYGGVSITFDANGGSFPYYGGDGAYKLAYAVQDGEVAIFGRGRYVTPTFNSEFEGWCEDAACTTPVAVNDSGYPVDADQNLITPTTENQTLWTRTAAGGYTLTLYAKYRTADVLYAVRLFGIDMDVDADGKALGLTFGPASGEDYRFLQEGADGSEAADYQSGSGYVAHCAKGEGVCLHWMTWEEIAAQSASNPHAFDACLIAGCTHSVKVYLNDTLKNASYADAGWTGDGAGILAVSFVNGYRKWNGTGSGNGGWAISKARYTLNGVDASTVPEGMEDYKTTYSGTEYICTEENCLLSCFETGLQNAIAAASKLSTTGVSKDTNPVYGNGSATTNDRLWLFSGYELAGEVEKCRWLVEGESIRYSPVDLSFTFYNEIGGQTPRWLRSASTATAMFVYYSGSSGWASNYPNIVNGGLAPGFCIR